MYPGSIAYAMPGVASSSSSPSFPDIEFVGAGSAASTTVTIPAGHQSGDLMIIAAWQDGPDPAPAAPGGGGWTLKISRTGFSIKNVRIYQKAATSGSETSGTWSNVDSLQCHVYRNASGIGLFATDSGSDSLVAIPAVALSVTDGSSWLMAWAAADGDFVQLSPSNLTERTDLSPNYRLQSWDTNAGVSSFTGRTGLGFNGSDEWRTIAAEILKATS